MTTTVSFPVLPEKGLTGMADLRIHSIHLQHSWFTPRWLYRCELQQFLPDLGGADLGGAGMISSLPCFISLPAENFQRPLADQDYRVAGRLIQTAGGRYRLKVSSKAVWTPIPHSKSWAEQRYHWKEGVSRWIQGRFSDRSTASFLAGLVTGNFEEETIRQQFARFGLLHLLAISGFHFAVIAGFLNVGLTLFFRQGMRVWALLMILGGYQFFLGAQASILRAWIMSSLGLLGGILHKPVNALNALGMALLLVLGYEPLLHQELGFQLSFAITAAILLFYAPMQSLLVQLFPKRPFREVIQMNGWNQYGYCVLAFLRQGLALTLAVNLLAFPLTLYYFQQFPWMSLLYNLFFPFLASFSLCLLILGAAFYFLPFMGFIGDFIHFFNQQYTSFLLRLTDQIPLELDVYLNWENLPASYLVGYLTVLFLGGMVWHQREKIANFIDN